MAKFNTGVGRDFLHQLREAGLLEYGSIITGDKVKALLDLEDPYKATRAEFNALQLFELKSIDYVRSALLNEGKYLASAGSGGYRILLPSENGNQCDRYTQAAIGKLNRALKLSRTTPPGDFPPPDKQSERAERHLHSLKTKRH